MQAVRDRVNSQLKIEVRGNGKSVRMECPDDFTVAELKNAVLEEFSIPVDRQRIVLHHGGIFIFN